MAFFYEYIGQQAREDNLTGTVGIVKHENFKWIDLDNNDFHAEKYQ